MSRWFVRASSSAPLISRSSISLPLGSSKTYMVCSFQSFLSFPFRVSGCATDTAEPETGEPPFLLLRPVLERQGQFFDGVVGVGAFEFVVLECLHPRAVERPASGFVPRAVIADDVHIAHVIGGQSPD